jgi:Exonuclease
MNAATAQKQVMGIEHQFKEGADVYFSADVETDGPIPGPFSILSFALVFAGTFDGERFIKPRDYRCAFYSELRPISDSYDAEALRVNGLDRNRLFAEGKPPEIAMEEACDWVRRVAGKGRPVLVAYPLSFDWSWLYWYFVRFAKEGSPFRHSRCFDIKTAIAVKGHLPISEASRPKLSPFLQSVHGHTHNALDDAAEQAEIFAKVFEWEGQRG